jgi:hypothetical protein
MKPRVLAKPQVDEAREVRGSDCLYPENYDGPMLRSLNGRLRLVRTRTRSDRTA